MISQKMQDALNDQVAYEFYSAHIYLSMSAFLESIDLPGLANWMRIQYQEEVSHAEKLFDYIIERDGRVVPTNWEAPPKEWKSALQAFEDALAHEQKVTARFNGHMDLAIAEKDHASQIFLQWFVNEQVEEETSVDKVARELKMAENAPGAMLMIDRELGQRVFTPPAPQGE